jgi:hypothetical protein
MATRTIQSRNYQPGNYTVDFPTVAEKRFSTCSINFSRENWPGTNQDTVATVVIERSEDGVNWEEIGAATFPGGVLTHPRTGQTVTSSSISFAFGNEDRVGDVRMRATVFQTLRTQITAVLDR